MLLKEKLVHSKSRLRLAPMYPPLPFWSVSPLVSVLMRFNWYFDAVKSKVAIFNNISSFGPLYFWVVFIFWGCLYFWGRLHFRVPLHFWGWHSFFRSSAFLRSVSQSLTIYLGLCLMPCPDNHKVKIIILVSNVLYCKSLLGHLWYLCKIPA